jgi:CheY-like chemotaxis protein
MDGQLMRNSPVDILLVEDSLLDIKMTKDALLECGMRHNLHIVMDGEEAVLFLRRNGKYLNAPRPSLILLDLNLPRKDGREVLADLKADPDLRRIPVVVLTTSTAEEDILKTYDLHVNCYVHKPVDLDEFLSAIRAISEFWLAVADLPVNL